ncbi:peptidase [Paracoccus suum]|uniref:Peptidase n=1 Tax=Paracoccus suum TaxID=2259340 RepID=A0A344PLA1_9RHOB|nr:peptidase [Paracoccus suum]AXC50156.1 peptidase [Paracoccus suum]
MDEHPAVAAARAWIGTPYVHQASTLGAGADCLGLVRGVWRRLYGPEPEALPAYSPDWGEVGGSELLLAGALRHLLAVPPDAPVAEGQVILFRMVERASAKHLGIVSCAGAAGAFIHAYDRHGVVESPLSRPWAARIVTRFTFPGQ